VANKKGNPGNRSGNEAAPCPSYREMLSPETRARLEAVEERRRRDDTDDEA